MDADGCHKQADRYDGAWAFAKLLEPAGIRREARGGSGNRLLVSLPWSKIRTNHRSSERTAYIPGTHTLRVNLGKSQQRTTLRQHHLLTQ